MIASNSNAHFLELKVVAMSNRSLVLLCLSSLRSALSGTLLLLAFSTLAAAQTQVRLLPAPREAHFGAMTSLPATIEVSVPGRDAADEFAASDLEDAIKQTAAHQDTRPARAQP